MVALTGEHWAVLRKHFHKSCFRSVRGLLDQLIMELSNRGAHQLETLVGYVASCCVQSTWTCINSSSEKWADLSIKGELIGYRWEPLPAALGCGSAGLVENERLAVREQRRFLEDKRTEWKERLTCRVLTDIFLGGHRQIREKDHAWPSQSNQYAHLMNVWEFWHKSLYFSWKRQECLKI